MFRFAVLADPHYHEIFPGYGIEGVEFRGRAGACIRTRTDSAASTRIFNESAIAFPAALEQCVAAGIRNVVIVGDLTDDGQIATMDAALALLAQYESKHDMRFFLTPGNHDVYGMSGRHHAKAFLTQTGGSVTVASDPAHIQAAGGPVVHEPRMYCRGYGETLPLWARHGPMRRPADIHWECPFGTDDAPEARMFAMRSPDGGAMHRQLDMSYLVEPEPKLWILSIDANVFEPRDGCPDNNDPEAFDDCTNAGWNALVRLKPFVLEWMADVARRAKLLGKTLVCFSHYPAVDPLDATLDGETKLLGATSAALRTPSEETARKVAATGVSTHFSGHVHYHDRNSVSVGDRRLTNIAVPSIVAFPPAFLLVEAAGAELKVETRLLRMPDYDAFFQYYRRETDACGPHTRWLEAPDYPRFLYGHVRELVLHRYIPNEWPDDLTCFLKGRCVDDLFALSRITAPIYPGTVDAILPAGTVGGITSLQFVTDWYAARKASDLLPEFVPQERLDLYSRLVVAWSHRSWDDPDCLQARVAVLVAMLGRYLEMEPCAMLADS